MIASEALNLLKTVKKTNEPCKANPCMTMREAVTAVENGIKKLVSSRGDIDLKDYCRGVYEIRVNQLVGGK